ncbi:metallophosphoesterase, partial [Candidatus Parcubacteria bacterium]
MRIAVLSDIHANALALEAVIRQARAEGCDTFWFLGDLVGRGPRPMDALRLLQAQAPAVWLSGNWDEGLVNDAFRDTFARHWWQVLEWQRMMLSRRNLEALQRALQGRPAIVIPKPGIHLAHGAFFLDKRKSLTEYWMSGMNVVLLFQHWQ